MMPEAAAVIAAAREFVASGVTAPGMGDLLHALEALDAKVATIGAAPSKVEQDRTWGEVVAGDEILSARTGKFYEVHTTVKTTAGKVKIMIKGAPKPILRDPAESIRIKRGVDGEALDIVEVLFSGTTRPTVTQGGGEAGPMLTDKVEDDDE